MNHIKPSTAKSGIFPRQTSTNASNSLSSTHSSNNYSESALITNEHSLLFQASTDTSLHHSSNSEEVDQEIIEAASILVSLCQNQSSLSHNPLEDSRQEGTTDINISGFNKPPSMDTKNIFLENPRKRKKPIPYNKPLVHTLQNTQQSSVSQSKVILMDHTEPVVLGRRSSKTSNQAAIASGRRSNQTSNQKPVSYPLKRKKNTMKKTKIQFSNLFKETLEKIPVKTLTASPDAKAIPCFENLVYQKYIELTSSSRKILINMENVALMPEEVFDVFKRTYARSDHIKILFTKLWRTGLLESQRSVDNPKSSTINIIKSLQDLKPSRHTYTSGNIRSIYCLNSSFTWEDIKTFTDWYQQSPETMTKIFIRELIQKTLVSTNSFYQRFYCDPQARRRIPKNLLAAPGKTFIIHMTTNCRNNKVTINFSSYLVHPAFSALVRKTPFWKKEISKTSSKIQNSVTSEKTNKFAIDRFADGSCQLFFLDGQYNYFVECDYEEIPLSTFEELQRTSTQEIKTSSSIVRMNNNTSSASSSAITDQEIIFPLQDNFNTLQAYGRPEQTESYRQKFERILREESTKDTALSNKEGEPDFDTLVLRTYYSLNIVPKRMALILMKNQPCTYEDLTNSFNRKYWYKKRKNPVFINPALELLKAGFIHVDTSDLIIKLRLSDCLNKLDLAAITYDSGNMKSIDCSFSFTSKDIEEFTNKYKNVSNQMKKFIRLIIANIFVTKNYSSKICRSDKYQDNSNSMNTSSFLNPFLKVDKGIFGRIKTKFYDETNNPMFLDFVNPYFAQLLKENPPWDVDDKIGQELEARIDSVPSRNTNKFAIRDVGNNRKELLLLDGAYCYDSRSAYEQVSVETFKKLKKESLKKESLL